LERSSARAQKGRASAATIQSDRWMSLVMAFLLFRR
jgi:hypothetical protein